MKPSFLTLILVASVSFVGCSDDISRSIDSTYSGENKTYKLASVFDDGMTGTIRFAERNDHTTLVTIVLSKTGGNIRPARIHANSAAENGDMIIELTDVDRISGVSQTIVSKKVDGTPISYGELLQLEAYVNIYEHPTNMVTLIAQGDIGANEVTETSRSFPIRAVTGSGITGSVIFAKRVNGNTLVTVNLDGTSQTGAYPVYIYGNTALARGAVSINLNTVDGQLGVRCTNVTKLNSGTAITYDQLVLFDGNIRVCASPLNLTSFVAEGNIGTDIVPESGTTIVSTE